MPSVPLPQFDSLVQGNDYVRPSAPTDDGADPVSLSYQIPDVPGGQPSPLSPMSTSTKQDLGAPLGAFLTTNLHEDNWLDPTKPHVSPEPQPQKG